MEEDIKILETLISKFNQIEEQNNYDHKLGLVVGYEELKAVENQIARYKETKQELESVKEIYYTQKEIEENYIPKSKVKEKIEELNFKLAEDVNGKIDATYNIRFTIQVLEELLLLED